MIRIAICDDEKNIRAYLSRLVREQEADCEITEYACAEEYLEDGAEYDLLYLDIELGASLGRMDGMGLARRIRDMELKVQPIIIFVTGYEEYVYDAFDVNAFQYLVKPVDERKFAEIFRRACFTLAHQADTIRKSDLLFIQHANISKAIPLENIYYMESRGHKIILHLRDGELEYYARLGDLEKELQGRFCRIHKGYLINLSYVEEYGRTEIMLVGGGKLPVSKYKYEEFVKAYLQFIR